MNNLVTSLNFGVKRFKQFRKHLVLDYKHGGKHDHRNPHAIPLPIKDRLLKVRNIGLSKPRAVTGGRSENSKGRA